MEFSVVTGPFIWVKGIKHGYCSCGREVSETDQTCPLCKRTLLGMPCVMSADLSQGDDFFGVIKTLKRRENDEKR